MGLVQLDLALQHEAEAVEGEVVLGEALAAEPEQRQLVLLGVGEVARHLLELEGAVHRLHVVAVVGTLDHDRDGFVGQLLVVGVCVLDLATVLLAQDVDLLAVGSPNLLAISSKLMS